MSAIGSLPTVSVLRQSLAARSTDDLFLSASFAEATRCLLRYATEQHLQSVPHDFARNALQHPDVSSKLWAKKFVVLLGMHLSDGFLQWLLRYDSAASLQVFSRRLNAEFHKWLIEDKTNTAPEVAGARPSGRRSRTAQVQHRPSYSCTEHFVWDMCIVYLRL